MNTSFGVRVTLHADRFARTFAGTGVGLGALTADREATEVANAAVALDTLEALQVHTDFAAEIALDDVLAFLDGMHDLGQLSFAQILGADGAIDACTLQDLFGINGTDAVDVTKGDIDALLRRNVHT